MESPLDRDFSGEAGLWRVLVGKERSETSGRWNKEEAGGARTVGTALSPLVFSYRLPISWLARTARKLVHAPSGRDAGGEGEEGSSRGDQG